MAMTSRHIVILVRNAEAPMGTNLYRAELWGRSGRGPLLATTRWMESRLLALKDARRCFPTFEVQDA